LRQPIFTGSAVAIVTPFKESGVDLDALGNLLDFQLENGQTRSWSAALPARPAP